MEISSVKISPPCKNGHNLPRNKKGECPECKRARDREYYKKNAAKITCKAISWNKENSERRKEIANEYYDRNKEKYASKRGERFAAWYYKDHDRTKQNKRVKQANRKNKILGSFTVEEVSVIRKLQQDKCACCSKKLNNGGHIDHIIPVSKGGLNIAKNLQLMCAFCNISKKDKDPIDFMQKNGRLL